VEDLYDEGNLCLGSDDINESWGMQYPSFIVHIGNDLSFHA